MFPSLHLRILPTPTYNACAHTNGGKQGKHLRTAVRRNRASPRLPFHALGAFILMSKWNEIYLWFDFICWSSDVHSCARHQEKKHGTFGQHLICQEIPLAMMCGWEKMRSRCSGCLDQSCRCAFILLMCPDGDPSGMVNVCRVPGFLLCMFMPSSLWVRVCIYETRHSYISYVAVTVQNEGF